MTAPKPKIFVDASSAPYLRPYIERELGPEFELVDSAAEAQWSARVYAGGEVRPADAREDFSLVVPAVVATGMQGIVRELLGDVAADRFFTIRSFSYPEIRLVHGSDIALALGIAARKRAKGAYRLDDGTPTTIDSLAAALAFRLNDKHLPALPGKWATVLGIGRRWKRYSEAPVPELPSFAEEFGFRPAAVCEYLRTHNYDENSL